MIRITSSPRVTRRATNPGHGKPSVLQLKGTLTSLKTETAWLFPFDNSSWSHKEKTKGDKRNKKGSWK
jgi:hypothetical protein